jgi:hypothetical protein
MCPFRRRFPAIASHNPPCLTKLSTQYLREPYYSYLLEVLLEAFVTFLKACQVLLHQVLYNGLA